VSEAFDIRHSRNITYVDTSAEKGVVASNAQRADVP